jgi:SAM-dependent methyltransferase
MHTVKLTAPPPQNLRQPRQTVRKLVEFKGLHRLSLPQYRDHVRQMYDGPAGAVLALGSLISLHEPLVGQLFKTRTFDVSRCRNILDIGSGAGQILGHLLKQAHPDAQLIGFDLSAQMLRRARQRLRSERPTFIAGDIARLPFVDDTFDCITCGWVIEHLPDPRPGLSEVGRVIKPGASALILATEDTLSGAFVSRTWKCRTYNRQELRRACEESGLAWKEQLWLSPVHRFFKMGGILVAATKPTAAEVAADNKLAPVIAS